MNPVLVIVTLVAATTLLGLLWRWRQGRLRPGNGRTVVTIADIPGARRLASGATLLQFSTEVCAPCAPTRALLGAVASERKDVAHIDLDLTRRPDLASKFNILQTPTTFILDRRGVVRARIGGAPRRDALDAELTRILETT